MTREEYLAVLATEPATWNQRGAIMREFERLGFGDADRAERLTVCAALLGLDELGSTARLVMGDAGQLVNTLQRIRDRAELAAVASAANDGQDDEAGADDGAWITNAEGSSPVADDGPGQGDAANRAGKTWLEVLARMVISMQPLMRNSEHTDAAAEQSKTQRPAP